MQCDRVRELLSLYMMGDLDDRADRSVARHLDECPVCRDLSKEFAEIGKALDSDEIPDPGEAFWRRFESSVMEKVDKEKRRSSGIAAFIDRLIAPIRRLDPLPAAVYASAVLLVAVLGMLFVWKAQMHFAAPSGMFTGLDLQVVEEVISYEPISVTLEDMSETELSQVWSAVASGDLDLNLPETVGDSYDETVTELAYTTYSELEYMEKDELLELELAIERWEENS